MYFTIMVQGAVNSALRRKYCWSNMSQKIMVLTNTGKEKISSNILL